MQAYWKIDFGAMAVLAAVLSSPALADPPVILPQEAVSAGAVAPQSGRYRTTGSEGSASAAMLSRSGGAGRYDRNPVEVLATGDTGLGSREDWGGKYKSRGALTERGMSALPTELAAN